MPKNPSNDGFFALLSKVICNMINIGVLSINYVRYVR